MSILVTLDELRSPLSSSECDDCGSTAGQALHFILVFDRVLIFPPDLFALAACAVCGAYALRGVRVDGELNKGVVRRALLLGPSPCWLLIGPGDSPGCGQCIRLTGP